MSNDIVSVPPTRHLLFLGSWKHPSLRLRHHLVIRPYSADPLRDWLFDNVACSVPTEVREAWFQARKRQQTRQPQYRGHYTPSEACKKMSIGSGSSRILARRVQGAGEWEANRSTGLLPPAITSATDLSATAQCDLPRPTVASY